MQYCCYFIIFLYELQHFCMLPQYIWKKYKGNIFGPGKTQGTECIKAVTVVKP